MPRTSSIDMSDFPPLDMSLVKEVEEKRAKREVANMNERRRMQNINSGFHSLRALLPQKHDGEKLSKAAILQHTSTYIYQLEQEITKLLAQNSELKRVIGGTASSAVGSNTPEWIKRFASEPPDCPSCKRRKFEDSNRHLDMSPLHDNDGSSTESSSEHEVNAKYRPKGGKQNGKSEGTGEPTIRKQLKRIERELEEERRIRKMFEEELGYHQNNGKSTSQNGRHYGNPGMDAASLMADEVEIAAESIEIEMHSCPASPPDVLTLPTIETVNPSALYLANQHSTEVSSQLEMGKRILEHQQQRSHKQNAIALPIDVPFVASQVLPEPNNKPTIVTNGNGSMVLLFDKGGNVMQIIDPTTSVAKQITVSSTSIGSQVVQFVTSAGTVGGKESAVSTVHSAKPGNSVTNTTSVPIMSSRKSTDSSPESATTSRQNLNTIVEAIRHLEGDHLFNESSDKLAKESPLKLKQEIPEEVAQVFASQLVNEGKLNGAAPNFANALLSDLIKHEPVDQTVILTNSLAEAQSNGVAIVTTASAISMSTDSQPRPQVIQRPNVIVATSVEN